MKVCVFLLALVLAAGLCVTASAGRIYTGGSSDGATYRYTRDWYNYDSVPPQSGESVSDIPQTTDGSSLGVSASYSRTGGSHSWTEERYDSHAVLIFPIASLSGVTGPITLSFYGSLPDLVSSTNEYAWWHEDQNLGATVVVDHSPLKNPSWVTLFAYQAPITTAGWRSLDVTAQVQQDLARGYSYSAFILGPTVLGSGYGSSSYGGSIGSAEGGYAAYLETVPEPASIATLMCGLGGVLSFAWRRRRPN